MNFYCNYAREHWARSDENQPVGLILCAEHGGGVARYALEGLANTTRSWPAAIARPCRRRSYWLRRWTRLGGYWKAAPYPGLSIRTGSDSDRASSWQVPGRRAKHLVVMPPHMLLRWHIRFRILD